MSAATSVSERLRSLTLTGAELRVAEVVLADPERVAFGTVADLATRAGTGGATVMRLATKAGFDGFKDLQEAVQRDLSTRLRPAAERIREQKSADTLGTSANTEASNVRRTLEAVDPDALGLATKTLTSAKTVAVVASDAAQGVASLFAADLGMLRPGVTSITGGTVGAVRSSARLGKGDTVVVIDVARYDRGVVDVVRALRSSGVSVIALTDSALAPVAKDALVSFTFADVGVGPFDSYVGALAFLNLLVAEVARRLQGTATTHLDRLEARWTELDALLGD
jgi:RpiR family transcriptional regulator, carbohydrate utilization regulator